MQPLKAIMLMKPCFPVRTISKFKPVVIKKEKYKSLLDDLTENPTIEKVDQDQTVLQTIALSLEHVGPGNPVKNWTHAQVSSAFRDYRFGDIIRTIVNRKLVNRRILKQDYSPVMEQNLGADIAAAHFLLSIGAQVRFAGHNDYLTSRSLLKNSLPLKFDASYKLEAIKLANAEIFDNGYKSLRNLEFVTHFDASKNVYFNNAQLDRVFCQFGGTLESIDVSHCNQITSSGLTALARFRKLKKAKMEGLEHVAHLEFLSLLLMESNEDLKIDGVKLPDDDEEDLKLHSEDADKDFTAHSS